MQVPEVRLELFEGPVELLLYLVRRSELDISEVPIGRLTDDFLGFVRGAPELNMESAADFLVMSGILVRLKMRALLPRPREEELDTPTVSLEQILDEFRRYQQAAQLLSRREDERRQVWPRPGGTLPPAPAAESQELSTLTAAFRRLLTRVRTERLVEVAPVKIRFEDKLAELRGLIRRRGRLAFEAAVGGNSITEIIVMFIAVLELVRTGEITVAQEGQFGTIELVARAATGENR
ncbi:MAG: segregation/condensation protein A [bacterium]